MFPRPPHRWAALLCLAAFSSSFSCRSVAGEDAGELWARKVQPLFDLQCVKCHGPIEQKGGLELDTPLAALKGGEEGVVLVPGKPEESKLLKNLAEGADPHMPPKKQLSQTEIEQVKQWIAALPPTVTPKELEAAPVVPQRAFPSISDAVNFYIADGWQKRGLTPAPLVSEAVWCRRLYLDLAGRLPTTAESEAFQNNSSPNKREALVDQLLASEDYVVHLRELWDVFLMGRGKRGNAEDRRKQNGWYAFLENGFRSNRPWNETVRALLAARPDGKPEDKGSSWFLYERKNEHQKIAEAVAPIIYGTKVDCAQCHDHPLAREIKQGHYWGLVAAFNRSKNVDGGNQVAESAVGGYMNFTNLKKESQPALISLLNGKTVPEIWPEGDQKEADSDDRYVDPKAKARVPKVSRRGALAEAATVDNPLLAKAFVNRMWSVLLGRGIVHPADEMNARNVPSHPELLEWLAQDFSKNNYNVRRFLRGMVLSQVYALGNSGTAPPEAFAQAGERALIAEQIARSWCVALGQPPEREALRKAVVTALPAVMPAEYNATFQQAQFLTNDSQITELLRPGSGKLLDRLAVIPDLPERVRLAFLEIYGRPPDGEETAQAVAFLTTKPDQPAEGLRDLAWAMLSSAEFLTMP